MAETTQEEIMARANHLTDESLESTRRMLQLAEESQHTGEKTGEMLVHQGEQLKGMEEGLDRMKQDMKHAEKNLTEMSKCCGLCLCPCDRVKTDKRGYKPARIKEEMSPAGVRGTAVSTQPMSASNGQPGRQATGPYIKRITNDAREDEMEENLEQVGSILSNLKTMAIDMGGEIDKQNKQIDRITQEAEMVNVRVQEADKRAKNLIS